MNSIRRFLSLLLFGFLICDQSAKAQPPQELWVTAYYAGWKQGQANNGLLPAEDIDYTALSHIIHFALVPNRDGTLDNMSNNITEINSSRLVSLAHAAGKKVLITVGGWGTDAGFRGATDPSNLNSFVDRLVNFMSSRGYDGIDIDWEVLQDYDSQPYSKFVELLGTRCSAVNPRPLITAAVASQPRLIAALEKYFDQIYVMTYDFSSAWPGWVTWHNSPIKDGGVQFPSSGRPLPSVDKMADDFIAAGLPKRKLGIGIDFYGYVWRGGSGTPTIGASAPGQSWTTPPQVEPNVPYFTIYKDYYRPEYYRWDTLAQAAYLSIHPSPDLADKFVSYDDEHTCRSKVEYARGKGIGGVFIWELGGGYLPATFSERDRLLQAVKQAALGGQGPLRAPLLESPRDGAKIAEADPVFQWRPVPGATSYLVQISSDAAFKSVTIQDSVISDTLSRIRKLKTGSTYYWRVGARSAATTSPFSNTWSFKTSK